jgi:metal-responsive CopG/Arc/MetJ family transcriptional regulator
MSKVTLCERTINIRIPCKLLDEIDKLVIEKGFSSRSELIRYVIREYIKREGKSS